MKEIAHGIKEKFMPDGTPVLSVYYYADPERDPRTPEGRLWVERERGKYKSQQEWDKENGIIHSAGGGERLFTDVLIAWGHKIIIESESNYEIPDTWRAIGGFDHGRINPTAALVGRVDFDGNIVLTGEYYQLGLNPSEHAKSLKNLKTFMDGEIWADPSIFNKTERESDNTYRAVNTLYMENGISHMIQTPKQYTYEGTGMDRILAHWMNLDKREPSLKIICPRDLRDIQTPIYGLHNNGCPNLLWELRRARREELSATQLVNRNPTEKIVDKDNHLRDVLKYIVMSLPDPSIKSASLRAKEAIDPMVQAARHQPTKAERDAMFTSALIHGQDILDEDTQAQEPIRIGRRMPFRRG